MAIGLSNTAWLSLRRGAQTCTDFGHGISELALVEGTDLGEQRPATRRIVHPFAPGRFVPFFAEDREKGRRAHLRQTLANLVPRTPDVSLKIVHLLHRVAHLRPSTSDVKRQAT